MTRAALSFSLFLLALAVGASTAAAHCQVPCGIYDDGARIAAMKEDATTIAKAVAQIGQLAGQGDAQSFNQAARWVATKEDHASRIITTVAEYFLTQKVKAPAAGAKKAEREHYHQLLADHHAVMKAAMKVKQTVDPSAVAALDAAIDEMGHHYTSEAPKKTQTRRSR